MNCKKRLTATLLTLFCLFSFASCQKDGSGDDGGGNSDFEVSISGIDAEVSGYGATMSVMIGVDSDWTISSNVDWVTFSRTTGTAIKETTTSLTAEVQFNYSDDPRQAVVTLYTENGDTSVTISQPVWTRPTTRLQVGDPDVTFDESAYDPSYEYYDQMLKWRTAGKPGGIPYEEDVLASVDYTFDSTVTSAELSAFFSSSAIKYNEVVVLLKNGTYWLDSEVRLYSNATLIGESRDGVIIEIAPDEEYDPAATTSLFSMYNADNVGIRNMTIHGNWVNEDGENFPKYTELGTDEIPDRVDFKTINMKHSTNCYVDNVSLLQNASHPIYITSTNNTIRNVYIKDAFNKGGSCEGYFFIDGSYTLITNCQVSGLRHISMQDATCEYNVLYDNDFDQEVSFHNSDNGNNLVEYNRIYLPSTMSEAYNAIMGPWSTSHTVGGLNMIYRNKCKEDNPGRGGVTPWSDDELYLGPYEESVGTNNANRYTNFAPVDTSLIPAAGTLYPIILD